MMAINVYKSDSGKTDIRCRSDIAASTVSTIRMPCDLFAQYGESLMRRSIAAHIAGHSKEASELLRCTLNIAQKL